MLNLLLVREAAASIAAAHADDCECVTCQAAGGDGDAFARLLYAIHRIADEQSPG